MQCRTEVSTDDDVGNSDMRALSISNSTSYVSALSNTLASCTVYSGMGTRCFVVLLMPVADDLTILTSRKTGCFGWRNRTRFKYRNVFLHCVQLASVFSTASDSLGVQFFSNWYDMRKLKSGNSTGFRRSPLISGARFWVNFTLLESTPPYASCILCFCINCLRSFDCTYCCTKSRPQISVRMLEKTCRCCFVLKYSVLMRNRCIPSA